MKKTISIILVIVMHISLIAVIGFDKQISNLGKKDILNFGLGVSVAYGEVKNASTEENGVGQAVVDIAAVLTDYEGKVVKCVLDCADSKVLFSSKGKGDSTLEFKTKRELGDDYGMVAYAGATAEWYAQADAFAKLCEGKTIDEIKALVVEGNKGTDEVMSAGCTIMIADFVKSIEIAMSNSVESKATSEDTIKLGVITSQTGTDATKKDNGNRELSTSIVATAINSEGKVSASSTDVAAVNFIFNNKGENLTDISTQLKTKKQLGTDYNMAAYGQDLNGDGIVKEWFEQAKAFDTALLGKTSDDISALLITDSENYGYAVESLQTAGCTIYVGDMIAAAVKASTI